MCTFYLYGGGLCMYARSTCIWLWLPAYGIYGHMWNYVKSKKGKSFTCFTTFYWLVYFIFLTGNLCFPAVLLLSVYSLYTPIAFISPLTIPSVTLCLCDSYVFSSFLFPSFCHSIFFFLFWVWAVLLIVILPSKDDCLTLGRIDLGGGAYVYSRHWSVKVPTHTYVLSHRAICCSQKGRTPSYHINWSLCAFTSVFLFLYTDH